MPNKGFDKKETNPKFKEKKVRQNTTRFEQLNEGSKELGKHEKLKFLIPIGLVILVISIFFWLIIWFRLSLMDLIFLFFIFIVGYLSIYSILKEEFSSILKWRLLFYAINYLLILIFFNMLINIPENNTKTEKGTAELLGMLIFFVFSLIAVVNICTFFAIIYLKRKKDTTAFGAIQEKEKNSVIITLQKGTSKKIVLYLILFLLPTLLTLFVSIVLVIINQNYTEKYIKSVFATYVFLLISIIFLELLIVQTNTIKWFYTSNKKEAGVIYSIGIREKIDIKREGKHIESLLYLVFNQLFVIIAVLYIELKFGELIFGKQLNLIDFPVYKYLINIKNVRSTITGFKISFWEDLAFLVIITFVFLIVVFVLIDVIKYLRATFLIPSTETDQVYPLFRFLLRYLYFHNILFSIHLAFWMAYIDKEYVSESDTPWELFGSYILFSIAIACGLYPYIFVGFMSLHEELYGYSKMFDFWFISKKNAKVIATSFTLIFLSLLFKENIVEEVHLTAWFISLITNFTILLIISYASTSDLWDYREELLNAVLAQKIANNIQVATGHLVIIGYEAVGRLYLEEILSRQDIINSLKIRNLEDKKVFLSGHSFSHVYLTNKIVIVAKEGGNIKFLDQIAGVKVGYVKALSKLLTKKTEDPYHKFHEVIIPVLIVNEEEVPYYQRICNLDKAALVVQTLGNAQISQAVLLSYLEFKSQEQSTNTKFILRVSRSKEKRFLVDLLTNKESIHQEVIPRKNNKEEVKDPNVVIFLGKELAGANTSAMVIHFYNLLNYQLNNLKSEILDLIAKRDYRISPEKVYLLTPFIGTDTTIGNYIASFLATYGLYGPYHQTSADNVPTQTYPLFITDSKITKDLISKNLLHPLKTELGRYSIIYPKDLISVYNPSVYYVVRDQRFLYNNFKTRGYYVISNIETSHIYFQTLTSLFNKPDIQKNPSQKESICCKAKWVMIIKVDGKSSTQQKPIVLLFPLTVFLPGDTQLKTIKVLRNFLPIFKDINLKTLQKNGKEIFAHDHKNLFSNIREETGYNHDVFVLNLTRGLIDHKFTISFYGTYLLKSIRKLIEMKGSSFSPDLIYGLMSKILSFQEFKRSLATIEVKQMGALSGLLLTNYLSETEESDNHIKNTIWKQIDICNTVPNNMAEIIKESYNILSSSLNIANEQVNTENSMNNHGKNGSKEQTLQQNAIKPRNEPTKLRLLFLNAYHCGREGFCETTERNGTKEKVIPKNAFLEFVVQEVNGKQSNNLDPYPHHCDLALECSASEFKQSRRDGIPTTDFFKISTKTYHFIVCFDGKMPGSLFKILNKISKAFFGVESIDLEADINYNYGCFYTRKCRFSRSNYLTSIWYKENIPENDETEEQNKSDEHIEQKINSIIITSFDIKSLLKIYDRIRNPQNNLFIRNLKSYGEFIPIPNTPIDEMEKEFQKNLVNFVSYFKREKIPRDIDDPHIKCLVNNCFSSSHLPISLNIDKKEQNNEKNENNSFNEMINNVLLHVLNSLENPITCPIATLKAISLFNQIQNQQKQQTT